MATARTKPSPSPISRWREELWRKLDKRLPSLTRRHRHESLPITLNQRRVYIIPSGFGVFFTVMMVAILAGALNYNNNSALLAGLLAISLGGVSMLQTFRNLDRLSLVQVSADPTHAGDPLHLSFHLHAEDQRTRFAISLKLGNEIRHVEISAGSTIPVEFVLSGAKRGWYVPEPLRISTVWPFGLFYAWSYVHSDVRTLIYPRAESPAKPLPRPPDPGRIGGTDPGDEDLRSLREYQLGDATRLIAWKASARTGELLVRQLEAPQSRETVLDFQSIDGLDSEQRLSRLTRWVLDAERAGMRYRLKLPGQNLGPDHGPAHRLRALKALALHALADT